jgi:hypothetical protein
MRGLLLVLDGAITFRPESRGTRDHILLPQIRSSSNLVREVPVFISPGTVWPSYIPKQRVLFSSPPTTRRAAEQLFQPTYTRGPRKMIPVIRLRHEQQRRFFHYFVFYCYWENNVTTELLLSKGCCTLDCFHSCYLATANVLSTACTAVTWQWAYISRYYKKICFWTLHINWKTGNRAMYQQKNFLALAIFYTDDELTLLRNFIRICTEIKKKLLISLETYMFFWIHPYYFCDLQNTILVGKAVEKRMYSCTKFSNFPHMKP